MCFWISVMAGIRQVLSVMNRSYYSVKGVADLFLFISDLRPLDVLSHTSLRLPALHSVQTYSWRGNESVCCQILTQQIQHTAVFLTWNIKKNNLQQPAVCFAMKHLIFFCLLRPIKTD